jgi:hypothetical protein
MMTFWRRMLTGLGLWIARRGGWRPCGLPHVPSDSQIDLVRLIVQDIEDRFPSTSGQVKAREALRVLLNLRPQARERDLNLLIELALQ